jgi:hypothetical protein
VVDGEALRDQTTARAAAMTAPNAQRPETLTSPPRSRWSGSRTRDDRHHRAP